MVARLVRDQEVVGSNPVASTKINGKTLCLPIDFDLWIGSRGCVGRQGEKFRCRSQVSVSDRIADTRCFPRESV